MANEQGTGHVLSKKRGNTGQNFTAYGGSLTLTGASVKNFRMHRVLNRESLQMSKEQEVAVKQNYQRRLSLQRQLVKFEEGKRRLTYLDGDLRGVPEMQWDTYTKRKLQTRYGAGFNARPIAVRQEMTLLKQQKVHTGTRQQCTAVSIKLEDKYSVEMRTAVNGNTVDRALVKINTLKIRRKKQKPTTISYE